MYRPYIPRNCIIYRRNTPHSRTRSGHDRAASGTRAQSACLKPSGDVLGRNLGIELEQSSCTEEQDTTQIPAPLADRGDGPVSHKHCTRWSGPIIRRRQTPRKNDFSVACGRSAAGRKVRSISTERRGRSRRNRSIAVPPCKCKRILFRDGRKCANEKRDPAAIILTKRHSETPAG